MKISLSTFIIQIINFTVLAYILYKVLYRPLRNIMEKRRRLVMEDVDRAIRMKEEALELKEKYDSLMAGIEAFRKAEMERAVSEAEKAKVEILDTAKRDAFNEKQKAAAVMESDRAEMMERLKKDAAEISSSLAARLIVPLADETVHAKLVAMMAEDLEAHPPATVRGGRNGSATITSAYPLNPGQASELESLLREHMDPGLRVEHAVDRSLIAGVRLWVDGQVMDGSLKGQLEYFRERALGAMEKDAGNS